MYDELVKALRGCVLSKPCNGCPYNDPNGPSEKCATMNIAAADAIEELSKPKWIPVTERLPEEYKNELCYYEYFRYGDYNCMFRTIDRGYYGNGIWGGEAGQGIRNKVLAWMPLPEPPKEE